MSAAAVRSPPAMPLVGRTGELAALSVALDAAVRGRGSVHFVVGEGGVGKTRVATAIADLAATKGFSRLVGRSYPVETGIPYALFADAFLPLLRSMPSSMLQVLARGSIAELATLFPALRTEGVTAGEIAEEQVKPRLFDSFSRFVQRLAQREPQLVTLENLHWADPSSLELLHILARGVAPHRIVLLCTYDETRRDANATLRATEQSLRSLDALCVHHLPALTGNETLELIRRQFGLRPDTVAAFAAKLHDRTQGNPFFIEETINALVADGSLREAEGRWTGWDLVELAMPGTVRDAISARLERLSPDARHVATIAAVVGVQVPHALLEILAGLSPDALLTAIDDLRHERMLEETEVNRELCYEFTHPLLREVLYTELSRARARALHAEVADALERRYGNDALAHAGAIAVHLLRAESLAQAGRACRYLVAAGSSALDRGANQEAAEALEAALVLCERDEGDTAAIETVLDLLARARQRLGDYVRASELWRRALARATAAANAPRIAGLERRLGMAAFFSGAYDDAVTHYDHGLEAARIAANDASIASLLLARSAVHLDVGRAAEAEADIRAALAIAERLNVPALLSRVHHALQLLAIWRGPADTAREQGTLALAFAREADDRAAAWNAEWAIATHSGLTGNSREMAQHLIAATSLAEELRSPVLRLWTDEMVIEYRASVGEWDEAVAIADRTIADARAFSQHTLLPRLLVWSSLLRFSRGEFDLGTAQMQEAWTLSGAERARSGAHVNVHAVVPAHVSRATWHLAQRQFRQALEVAEAGLVIADRTGYVAWAVHRLVPIAGEAALFLHEFERAAHYCARLRAAAERLGHPLGMAWADAGIAIAQQMQGDAKGSIAPLVRAAESLEAIPFVEYAARVRFVLTDAYYESGDTDSAVRELRRVHEVFAKLGAKPWVEQVRERLRQLGVRPPARSTAEGVGALTAREVEIAKLVAARKSNKEIAAALEISARTVGTHLSNVFGKLGVDSRGALTDLVREGALEATSQ